MVTISHINVQQFAPFWLYFLILIILGVFLVCAIGFYLKAKRREKFKMSLDLVLFSVRIPPKSPEEIQQAAKQEKDWMK